MRSSPKMKDEDEAGGQGKILQKSRNSMMAGRFFGRFFEVNFYDCTMNISTLPGLQSLI